MFSTFLEIEMSWTKLEYWSVIFAFKQILSNCDLTLSNTTRTLHSSDQHLSQVSGIFCNRDRTVLWFHALPIRNSYFLILRSSFSVYFGNCPEMLKFFVLRLHPVRLHIHIVLFSWWLVFFCPNPIPGSWWFVFFFPSPVPGQLGPIKIH